MNLASDLGRDAWIATLVCTYYPAAILLMSKQSCSGSRIYVKIGMDWRHRMKSTSKILVTALTVSIIAMIISVIALGVVLSKV